MHLIEINIYKGSELVFLLPGHTKNSCDTSFSSMKHTYNKVNIWCINMLYYSLNVSDHVTCIPVTHKDFSKMG